MSKSCGNPECAVSTGIHEGLTFGHGRLSSLGFFEFPCAPCAREHENAHPEDGECWPYANQDVEELGKAIKEDCDNEDEEWKYWMHG